MEKVKRNQLIESFKKAVSTAKSQGFYLDCNYLSKKEFSIRKDLNSTNVDKDNDSGIKLRIWDGEKLIESASSSLSSSTIENICLDLINIAKKK